MEAVERHAQREVILERHEKNSQAWSEPLKEELTQAGAQIVLAHVNSQLASAGKYNVQAAGDVHTVVQGDNIQVAVHTQPKEISRTL